MASDNETQNILQFPWFPKTNPPMAGGSRSGEWMGRDQAFLGNLASTLVYEVGSKRVNSLPSPWSRALQFEQAVLNSRYPTRDALLQELFGCFATVGLWEMFGLKLDAERVSLADYVKVNDEAVGPFAKSLMSSLPSDERSLFSLTDGSNPWNSIHVLKVQEVVIGFTSPTTILCPAVHLSQTIPGMNWTANGTFGDPTPFLSIQQRQALGNWLSHVVVEIGREPNLKSQRMLSHVSEVINGFVSTLLQGGKPENAVLSDKRVPSLPSQQKAIDILARPAKGGVSASQTTLELSDRRNRELSGTPKKPVILLDPEMPGKLGLAPNELTLFKSATLESVNCDKSQLERLYKDEIEVLTPDDIFLPELFLLLGGAALVNTWIYSKLEGEPVINGNPVTPLLPLNERVRELFSSEELRRACSMRVVRTGAGMEIEVTLMLPIEKQRLPYPIIRSYPLKEQNLIDQDLPVITIWPFIADDSWEAFYIFCEDSSSGLTVDGFADYDLNKGKEGQENVKYFATKRFPDIVKLIERGQVCGLVPVSSPPPTMNGSDTWRVGLDFGTSFTNFFVDDGSGPTRKSLETRVVPLTLAESESQLNRLYKYFIPEVLLPKDANPPTSTALNTYGWQESKGTVPELFHQARVQWPSRNADALRGPGVRTGFKWTQLQYQKPFLKELALLISINAAAAGARQVNWFVSYPSAFSPNESRSYRRVWAEVCTDLSALTGMKQVFSEDSGVGGLQTEAVAFASYFGNYKNRPMVHTACLDVGGGTTDISIWQENSLLHQVSVPFAGRDICTGVLQNKPSFIRFLFPPSIVGDITDNEAKLRQDPNFHSWFDNCLRLQSDELLRDRIPIHRAEKEKQLIEFVSIMAISFGGIYHYLGLIFKALANEGKLQKKAPAPVYIGGNGARLLNWLEESGEFIPGCDSDILFEELQRMSFGSVETSKGTASTILSKEYKDETACGLISRGVNLKGDFDPRDEPMISGEELIVNDMVFGPLDRVSIPDSTEKIKTLQLGSMRELRRFVENYDNALTSQRITSLLPIKKLSAADTLWDAVETLAQSYCLEYREKDFGNYEPVPGFVIGLKGLVHVLARQWADRF